MTGISPDTPMTDLTEFLRRPRRTTDPPAVSRKDVTESKPKHRRRNSVDSRTLETSETIHEILRPIGPNIIKARKQSNRHKEDGSSHLSKTGILKFIPLGRRQPKASSGIEDPLEEIIKKMQDNFSIVDRGQTVPVRVQIPDKDQLTMASACNDLFEENVRPDIFPPRSGFKASEFIKSGALDYVDLQDCDLQGPIHPIFQEENWTDVPTHIYKTFQPALKLATKFLTTSYCLQYWVTLIHGERQKDIFSSAISKHRRCRIHQDVPNTSELAHETIEHLKSLAPFIEFQFHDLDHSIFMMCGAPICHKSHTMLGVEQIHYAPFVTPKIYIHTDFYTAAQRLSELKFPDRTHVLRYSLSLAVMLLHELAHAVESTRHPPEREVMTVGEDFIYGHPVAEAGRAWEKQMLGGILQPVNFRCDALHGLVITDWPVGKGFWKGGLPDIGLEFYTVSMEYVGRFFREEFWKKIDETPLDKVGAIHIPKDGIRGVGAPMCNTAREKDFEGDDARGEVLHEVLREIVQKGVKVSTGIDVKRHRRSGKQARRHKIGLGCSRRLIKATC